MGLFSKWFKSEPDPNTLNPKTDAMVYCVPQSVACAWAWAALKKRPVRIAISKINDRQNIDHSQAETLKDGIWRPLEMRWTDQGPVTFIGHRHFDAKPYRTRTLNQWIAEQVKYTDI